MTLRDLLKPARLTHLYFGVFISPAILFFALTGALQAFGLHETSRDRPDYRPARWIVVLGQLHKKQTLVVPERRSVPAVKAEPGSAPAAKAGVSAVDAATAPARASAALAKDAGPPVRKRNLIPMKIFFLVVCVGLFWSTLTGMFMAYNYLRNKKLVTLAWVLGIVVPVSLMFL